MQMEDVLTLLGLAGGVYWLVNNRTKTSTRETITERKTILTDSGSITYERQREIDSKQMAIMREGVRQFEKSKNVTPVNTEPQQAIINRDTATHLTAIASTKANSPVATHKPIQQQPIERPAPQPPTTVTRTTYSVIDEPPAKGVVIESIKTTPQSVKRCPKCRKTKPTTSFRSNSNTPDGLTKWCIDCMTSPGEERHYKICPKCGMRRLKTNFEENKNRPDKLTKWCRYCLNRK